MNLFMGPGKHLMIPLKRVLNPNCPLERFIRTGKKSRRKDEMLCECLFTYLSVPFGYWYTTHPHPEVFRQCTKEEFDGQRVATRTGMRHS